MVVPSAGSLVLIPFPFSDLSQAKLRPAAVLASVGRGDWILCQITSNPYGDPLAVELSSRILSTGSLRSVSFVRPGKLFTANEQLVVREIGQLRVETLDQIVDQVIGILRSHVS